MTDKTTELIELTDVLARVGKRMLSDLIDQAFAHKPDDEPEVEEAVEPSSAVGVEDRVRDLTDALTALTKHYKRHTSHRCEIITDAETVLAGKPKPRFDPDDYPIEFIKTTQPPKEILLQNLRDGVIDDGPVLRYGETTVSPGYLCGYESVPDEPGRFCRRIKGHRGEHLEYPTKTEREWLDGFAAQKIPFHAGEHALNVFQVYPGTTLKGERLGCSKDGFDWPCQYAQGWARGWDDRRNSSVETAAFPRGHSGRRVIATLAYVLDVLSVMQEADAFGELIWRVDTNADRTRRVTFSMLCNDVFYWGTADAEDITPQNVGLLKKTWDELNALEGDDAVWQVVNLTRHATSYFAELFAARARGMRPQEPVYKNLNPKLTELFNACGPERPAGDAG